MEAKFYYSSLDDTPLSIDSGEFKLFIKNQRIFLTPDKTIPEILIYAKHHEKECKGATWRITPDDDSGSIKYGGIIAKGQLNNHGMSTISWLPDGNYTLGIGIN